MYRIVFWLCAVCLVACLLSTGIPRPRLQQANAPSDDDKSVAPRSDEEPKSQRVEEPKTQQIAPAPKQTIEQSVASHKTVQPTTSDEPVDHSQDDADADPELPPDDEFTLVLEQSKIKLVRDTLPKTPVNLLDSSTANPLKSAEPEQKPPPLSPRMAELKRRLGSTLAYYRKWPINTINRSPWEVMHGAIAFGCQSQLTRAADNRKITALGHLCFNGVCEGDSLLRVYGNRLVPRRGDGLQGHDGQLLSIIAQSKVKIDYPIRAYGRKFTVADLVANEKRSVRSGTELTFQLIGLIHYLRGAEEKWKNDEGEDWSIRRMLKEEINSPVRGAACGGTHRLMAISYAYKKRIKRGFPITGQYKRARKYVEDYHRYTFRLQNSDGSFSTDWFRGRGSDRSVDLRMKTTGHIFEWLAFSLTDEQLRDKKMTSAAEHLTSLLGVNRQRNWKIGPLGHALHGLVMYEDRMFGKRRTPAPQTAQPTRKPERTAMLPKTSRPSPKLPRDVKTPAVVAP